MALVLVPQEEGLSTAGVFAALDRLRAGSSSRPASVLDPVPLRRLAASPLAELATGLANDLQLAAISLRPELEDAVARLLGAGALAAQVTGSGPTTFGIFGDRPTAALAASALEGAILTDTRSC
jgi:4-diphosphocytidyl-2-C-methyl-D-erythritol kinase